MVTVATDGAHAERELQAVVTEIERHEPGLITRTEIEHLALTGLGREPGPAAAACVTPASRAPSR